MSLFSTHKVCWRVRQLSVKLSEIRKNEALYLTDPLRLMQSMYRSILCPIKNRAENTEHPRKHELAWGVLPEAITCRAANNRFDGNNIQADIRRAVRPETAEAEIIVDAAVGQDDAVGF